MSGAHVAQLVGRERECAVLDALIHRVRAGDGHALVIRGEAGMGKTALLEYLTGRALDCRVIRVAGARSETTVTFAGLHQLCAPLLPHLTGVSRPLADGLRTAFGLHPGPADRLLLGVAVLELLAAAAAARPLLCVVDNAHLLDQASVEVLGFAARRLAGQSVGLVISTRMRDDVLQGLPEMEVRGLREQDASALVDSKLAGSVDVRVRDQIAAETLGNPLIIGEALRGVTATQLAGGFGVPGALPADDEWVRRQLDGLSAESRRLLVLAAAEPTGDATLVCRAAALLGVSAAASGPVVTARLVRLGARVRFSHLHVRVATYRSATLEERRDVHRALAEATDAEADPDWRAWHHGQAASSPDEVVADELESAAEHARERGGQAAVGAFYERAALLTPDPATQVTRALAAARAMHLAGDRDAALGMLAMAEAGPQDELTGARALALRARIVGGGEGRALLVEAARRLEEVDLEQAREAYVDALSAAARSGDGVEIAKAVSERRARGSRDAVDMLLDGVAVLAIDGYAVGTPLVRQALRALCDGRRFGDEDVELLSLAARAAHETWDDEACRHLANRQVYHASVVHNGSGEYEEALALALRANAHADQDGTANQILVELIEAAVRSGQSAHAHAAFERLVASTRPSGTAWGLGIEARCRALLSDEDTAERWYRESITQLSRCLVREDLARAHLLYGEWLRRQRRRADARVQLRTAHDMLDAMGMDAFAGRARRELRATGETARKRVVATPELTPQEAQIAQLARDGLSNPQIGARLYLSPRTVQYHLSKVFTKLGLTSRSQLRGAIPSTAVHGGRLP